MREDSLYVRYFKRVFDAIAAALGLLFLFPVFIIIAILIKLEDGGSVFFRQERVGQNWKTFRIYKFRTMVEDAEKLGAQVTTGDDPRITRIGRFLRKYKLDELPQLINVIKGEMSLVGPRPEVPKYAKLFKQDYDEILKVKPGITDFASIEYKDENELLRGVSDPEKVYTNKILPQKINYYKEYIERVSFLTDFILILRTLRRIIK